MSNLLLSKIGHVISEFPLAFKQTKEVKLFMTLLVKNEEGMLEENLQFHKASKHSASCVFFSPLFLPTFVASL